MAGLFLWGGSVRELENVRDNVLQIFNKDSWIQFIHEGLLPAYTDKEKEFNVELAKLSRHCAICRNINGCCFPKNNKPKYPLHPNCHCFIIDIVKPKITVECPERKFTEYIFALSGEKKGKMQMFKDWGYDIMDSEYLVEELEKQAKEKYSNGDFILGKLDGFGQRISIRTELERRKGEGKVSFISGWLVYPDGNIQNTTPYGDK